MELCNYIKKLDLIKSRQFSLNFRFSGKENDGFYIALPYETNFNSNYIILLGYLTDKIILKVKCNVNEELFTSILDLLNGFDIEFYIEIYWSYLESDLNHVISILNEFENKSDLLFSCKCIAYDFKDDIDESFRWSRTDKMLELLRRLISSKNIVSHCYNSKLIIYI